MCLLAIAWRVRPDAPLVLVANRDEFHARPAAPAELWPEAPELLAGRDLQAGGTWLGVTRSGRVAALTNFRGPAQHRGETRSRGQLVADFLRGSQSPYSYLESISRDPDAYNGFNLLVGDGRYLAWYSNVARRIASVPPGVHGLSNALLDVPWPKVTRTQRRLEELLGFPSPPEPASLLELLADRERAPDYQLPDTGVGLEWERLLSSPFIVSPLYGTRCSTTVVTGSDGRTAFVERTFDPAGDELGTRSFALG